ncbi:MAG TPA: hypothetical protein VI197_04525 [Polyangiaceae bacterium]
MDPAKMKIVYAITSREAKPGIAHKPPKKYWHRVGVAFVNRDGSLSVKLEALPVSGELHIRDYVPASEPAPEPPAMPSRRAGASAIL